MSGLLGSLILQGVGYGFLAGVTIGPFLGYLINVVLTRGWRQSLPLLTIPPVVDTPIIIGVVLVLGQLPEMAVDAVSVLGGTFVIWLGWNTWRDNRTRLRQQKSKTKPSEESAVVSIRGAYLRGLLVNALNPAPYLFWSAVSGPILLEALDQSFGYATAFLFSYYAVFLMLIFGLMLLVNRIGEVDERFNQAMQPVTVILLFVLGAALMGAGLIDIIRLSLIGNI